MGGWVDGWVGGWIVGGWVGGRTYHLARDADPVRAGAKDEDVRAVLLEG